MHFSLRWPDGSESLCYSPSSVVEEFFVPGSLYALPEFVARSHAALGAASERVRQRYGFACARAMGQLAEIERRAADFAATADAAVTVVAFHRD
jgi:uncharacterized repeat protein (TIGR04042 family)